MSRALRDPTLAVAAGAGVATHLPGLLYLLGLNAISDAGPGLALGTVNVLIFDAIWFAIPIAALAVALRHPAAARVALDRGSAWARRHERQLATVVFAVVGVAFALKGAVALLELRFRALGAGELRPRASDLRGTWGSRGAISTLAAVQSPSVMARGGNGAR